MNGQTAMGSPNFHSTTLQTRSPTNSYQPLDRTLPSRSVNAQTLTDAYVSFILYCNPHFPLDTDATLLRTNFNTPPKSDNKEFPTARLWDLLQRFEAKEIKTWGQLATELGVEPPDVSKGQSAQKVQQYTVRLKRWMHAMHIDAFFEFLLGKEHSYFTQIPHPSNPFPQGGRDGVVAEEDTAVRALDPAFRPKRGRRRNSEAEAEEEERADRAKQARLSGHFALEGGQPQSAYPRSAVPVSAHPDGAHQDPWAVASAVTPSQFAQWSRHAHLAPQSALTPSAPPHMRWHGGNGMTPATPHPMTALPSGSMASHIDAAFENEPRSAVTPSTKRKRRHGPAVSSAWPSAHPPGAKPRGRPPAANKAQDSAFTTFRSAPPPPHPTSAAAGAESPVLDATAATPDSPLAAMPPPVSAPQTSGRPGRLSLQVPQHTGGPVRLATPPPPRVVVSGDIAPPSSTERSHSATPDPPPRSAPQLPTPYTAPYPPTPAPTQELPLFPFETLKRALTTDLLRADLHGRTTRLSGDEAKRLADAMLDRLAVPRAPKNTSSAARDTTTRLTAASWLGLGDQLLIPSGPAVGSTKRVTLTRFRTDSDGYEEIVPPDTEFPGEVLREIWDVSWSAAQGGCTGTFGISGLSLGLGGAGRDNNPTGKVPDTDIHDLIVTTVLEASRGLAEPVDEVALGARMRRSGGGGGNRGNAGNGGPGGGRDGVGADGVDWKARCMALEFGSRIAHGEMVRYKGRVLEEVLDVLLRQ